MKLNNEHPDGQTADVHVDTLDQLIDEVLNTSGIERTILCMTNDSILCEDMTCVGIFASTKEHGLKNKSFFACGAGQFI